MRRERPKKYSMGALISKVYSAAQKQRNRRQQDNSPEGSSNGGGKKKVKKSRQTMSPAAARAVRKKVRREGPDLLHLLVPLPFLSELFPPFRHFLVLPPGRDCPVGQARPGQAGPGSLPRDPT